MKNTQNNNGKSYRKGILPPSQLRKTYKDLTNLPNVSKESLDWFKVCVDPYHDFTVDTAGLPDERTAPSVVQVHNQSYTLTAPVSAAGGNWDASILYSGINSLIGTPIGMMTVSSSSGMTYNHTSLSTGAEFGALAIWAGAAGSTMSTGAPITSNDTTKALGSVLATDRCRLIACGFEIHNTTAEIYRQGSLTVANLPDCACDSTNSLYIDTAASPIDNKEFQADRALKQASTLPYLMAVPGSETWPAALGCYVIPRMTMVPRDILSYATGAGNAGSGSNSRVPILYGTDGKIALPAPTGDVAVKAGSKFVPITAPSGPSGFSPVQVFLSGLSTQSTITITFRTVVEYFPALDSPLLPLASPSSCFDPAILHLYSQVVYRLKVAVPVSENAAGDYFRKVLGVLSEVLIRTAPMFGQYAPIASMAGQMGKKLLTFV